MLEFSEARSVDEFHYASLPLCVIDAVFSIGVRYASTTNVVQRFCTHFGLPRVSEVEVPAIADQMSMEEFCQCYLARGVEGMARDVYCNWHRTSSRNGILKSEAALLFGQALCDHGTNFFQDIENVLGQSSFETQIQKIPGHGSGISLRYFYMLAGSSDYVKPDRMVQRFVLSATGRKLGPEELQSLLVATCDVLVRDYPDLTPRSLDHLVWKHQRMQKGTLVCGPGDCRLAP